MDTNIQAVLMAFNDTREGVRVFAVRKAARCGAEIAPFLIDLLKDKNGTAQECADMALRQMGEAALPFLIDALQSDDRTIRWQAAAILSSMGEPAHKAVRDSQRLIVLNQTAAS